jgi:hypothetical protein
MGTSSAIDVISGQINLRTNNKSLIFNSNGGLVFPDTSTQWTAASPIAYTQASF